MNEWESKIEAIANTTIQEDVSSLAGVPSWMLILARKVLEKTGASNLHEVWPNLELFIHGGISFVPYKEQFLNLVGHKNINFIETYNASEGFFGLQIGEEPVLTLMPNYGIFYEFISMDTYGTLDQKVIPLWEVKLHQNYAIIITTNAGLWRYKIGDTVRFTSINPYRIKITGRTKHHINVFGEELIIENAEEALKNVCKKTGAEIKDYTVAPIFMVGKEKGAHEWIIEFHKEPEDIHYFTEFLDNALKSLNSDYEAKRYNNITLKMPTVHIAESNLFYNWLKQNNKLGGQHKIPRLSNSRDYIDELLTINK